eukprot:SAG31_NODE_12077_length_970_cov_2.024110_1_plen_34_part_01
MCTHTHTHTDHILNLVYYSCNLNLHVVLVSCTWM